VWDPKAHGWSVVAGDYDVTLGASSRAVSATTRVALKAQALPVSPLAR
jgi:beta-glucosidase